MVQKIHTLQRKLIQKTEEVYVCSMLFDPITFHVYTQQSGGREGAANSREREAVYGVKDHSAATARA